ncbi:magnesium and cobalt transport protein CorA [Spirilliplanes yamanashiensis]|uniref:Magnesium transport protein CorA n=1 Tax=Spirilliplanes yamanashiensis TaxID=42233 RepID=A0A8J4DJJ3_9ACTN|nr:magnesium and cobalt transport protein CorA [Spirilliplanes yamanashiensis]MDP9815642.1 magnesium transporter [Spirilliplanes yamanashiensis]GIJ03896.1 magnesium transport protein CorA [Spirilliplanes yamanashiensis]
MARRGLLVSVVSRLLPRERPEPPAGPPRPQPAAVVDCAVYADGRRLPGRPHWADAIRQARRRRGAFVWLGLHEPDAALMRAVGAAYGLHELTVGQAVAAGHRPAAERHGEATLLVLRTAAYVAQGELTATSEVVDTGDVMVLLGDDFAITVRHGAPGALSEVRAGLEAQPAVLAAGPWSVAYAVLDRMVGSYLEVAEHLQGDLEDVEEAVFGDQRGAEIAHMYQFKRELVEFKRAVLPLHPHMQSLLDDHGADIPPALHRYVGHVAGRLGKAVDRLTGLDELLNSILQARLAQVSIDQNNDMRKIASWAAIAAAQTAIAGVYGMNFADMPELTWRYGYYGVLLLMALVAVALHRSFRRSGWL